MRLISMILALTIEEWRSIDMVTIMAIIVVLALLLLTTLCIAYGTRCIVDMVRHRKTDILHEFDKEIVRPTYKDYTIPDTGSNVIDVTESTKSTKSTDA